MRERLKRWKHTLSPGPRSWRVAGTSLLRFTILVFLVQLGYVMITRRPNWAALLVFAAVAVAIGLLGGALVLAVFLMGKLPPRYGWILGSCAVMLLLNFGGPDPGGWTISASIVVVASLLGAGIGGIQSSSQPRRAIALFGFLLGFIGLLCGIGWMIWKGPSLKTVANAATKSSFRAAPLALGDPSLSGPYAVRTLTYGSGADHQRPEFGASVTLRTKPVDGSKLLDAWKGRAAWARTRYWGFDAKQLPVQARVWYPEGPGPFPLALIVHGNHEAEKFSDPGYEYLGRHLASQGFILASVDENFLNSSITDLLGVPDIGLKEESDARGWMLLEHLRVWREWNKTTGNPLQGKVDMNNVALMGHSRGGEAVAIAAVFNRLSRYPDNANLPFDFNFNLRAVVAIAPVDGQYKPAGEPSKPENVNYMVLHGTYDGDVQSFHGSRVLERVKFNDKQFHFKTSLYVDHANHGQFNTGWGWSDWGSIAEWALNRRGIMPAKDQERIAKVAITAFLEASLRGQPGYLPLFRDWRVARSWLPDTIYMQEYVDSSTEWLANFDEDIDASTTTIAGGGLRGENLSDWKERLVKIKWGELDTRAVFLGWTRKEAPGEPSYTLTLPASGAAATGAVLTFTLADSKQSPSAYDKKDDKKKDDKKDQKDEKKEPEPIDLTIEVTDSTGASARVPLSSYAFLQPQLESQILKAKYMNSTANSEVVYQTFEFPVAVFKGVDPAKLHTIRWIFNRSEKGVVILDNVGLRPDQSRDRPGSQ